MANTRRSCEVYRGRAALPVQHHQLMPKHGDLDVFDIRCRTQPDRSKHPSDNHECERAYHHDRQSAASCLRCSRL
jgi:hypothetical protein